MPRILSRLLGLALLLGIVLTPMIAPRVSAQDATPCPALTEEDATAWAANWAAAWNSHDPAQVTALYTPDAIHHWGIGFDVQGHDELTASFENFFTAFPGVRNTVEQVLLVDDTIVIRWIAIGIQETEYMGIPPSRETVTWTGIIILQTECGLITEAWAEVDHFGRVQQQGVFDMLMTEEEATPAAA